MFYLQSHSSGLTFFKCDMFCLDLPISEYSHSPTIQSALEEIYSVCWGSATSSIFLWSSLTPACARNTTEVIQALWFTRNLARESQVGGKEQLCRRWESSSGRGDAMVGSDLFSSNRVRLGRTALLSSFSCSLLLSDPHWDKISIFICSIQARQSWIEPPCEKRQSTWF